MFSGVFLLLLSSPLNAAGRVVSVSWILMARCQVTIGVERILGVGFGG